MINERKKEIPQKKIKAVEELVNLIKNKKTILITSIKNIPASQFQEIGKKLRGKAIVKVPKKNIILRAFENSGNNEAKKLESEITESIAILFSDLDSFELAGQLLQNTTATKAKAGQEAPEDIEIPEGPTDLVPGPAISELGALGIEIQIEKGKIHIKKPKIIAKKGAKISPGAANLMSKLDIKPFSIGFIPQSAFDTKENKLYLEIKIDKEGTINELKDSFAKSLAFAVEISYFSKETIGFLLAKANAHGKAIENLIGTKKSTEEETKEETSDGEKEAETPSEEKEAETPSEEKEAETPSEEKEAETPSEEKEAETPSEENNTQKSEETK